MNLRLKNRGHWVLSQKGLPLNVPSRALDPRDERSASEVQVEPHLV